MTTDPTPHTERAAAAAAEIHPECSREWFETIPDDRRELYAGMFIYAQAMRDKLAASIAKHFNDDAAELAKLRGFYDEIVREIGHDQIITEHRQRGELLRREARRRKEAESQHDALRLAAGRALELLREAPYYDKPRDPIAEAITALSAALADEQKKTTEGS